jgi:hypothetical protein
VTGSAAQIKPKDAMESMQEFGELFLSSAMVKKDKKDPQEKLEKIARNQKSNVEIVVDEEIPEQNLVPAE